MNKIFKIICISLLAIGLLSSVVYPVLAAPGRGPSSTVCREGNSHCAYPGDCHDYTDSNNDGYCDRSSSSGGSSSTVSPATSAGATGNSNNQTANIQSAESAATAVSGTGVSSTAASSAATGTQNNQPGRQSEYNILLISIIVVLTYALTYVLSKRKVITLLLHRKIWNGILLVSVLGMLILSLLLILSVDYGLVVQLPFDIKFWHVELGIVMGVIAVLHICWHWRYFTGLMKNGKQA